MLKTVVAYETEVNKTVNYGHQLQRSRLVKLEVRYIWSTNCKLQVCAIQLLIHLINLLLP